MVRVMSRLFCIDGSPAGKDVAARINAVAGALLDPKRPGDFNQVTKTGAGGGRGSWGATDEWVW